MPAVAGRGLGWKRDPVKLPGETPDRVARKRLGAAPPPPAASARHLILDILDQKSLGSCVANAGMQALRASQVKHGETNPPLGSRLFAYYLARAYDHDTANDDGTFVRNFFQAVVKFGFPPEGAWPYSDDTGPGAPFRKMPPITAFAMAFDQSAKMTVPVYERINTDGAERILDIKRAIAAGHLVVFGTDVSVDFCNGDLGTGPISPPIGKPIAGGHALCMAAYDHGGVTICNSWGKDWGDQGFCTFSWDYATWSATEDLWVCDMAPAFSEDT